MCLHFCQGLGWGGGQDAGSARTAGGCGMEKLTWFLPGVHVPRGQRLGIHNHVDSGRDPAAERGDGLDHEKEGAFSRIQQSRRGDPGFQITAETPVASKAVPARSDRLLVKKPGWNQVDLKK